MEKQAKTIVAVVKKFAPRKTTMPIMGYAHVTPGYVEVSNLDMGIRLSRGYDFETRKVKACVEVQDLESVLLSDCDIKDSKIVATRYGVEQKIDYVCSSEYPDLEQWRDKADSLFGVELTKQQWGNLQQVAESASRDESRFNLCGVCLRDGQAIATDGRRLAMTAFPTLQKSLILPIAFVRALKDLEPTAITRYGDLFVEITGSIKGVRVVAWCRCIDMQFPDITALGIDSLQVGQNKIGSISETSDLSTHLERITKARKEKDLSVQFTMNGHLAVEHPSYAATVSGWSGEDHKEVKILLNPRYVNTALGSGEVTIFSRGDLGPVIFQGKEVKHVIMPMRK